MPPVAGWWWWSSTHSDDLSLSPFVCSACPTQQPGMTAVFGALRMDWRFLITVSSTVSSAFVLLNQIQKYGARGATGAITS